MQILSFDPGGTTGWSSYTADLLFVSNSQPEYFRERYDMAEMGPHEHHRTLYELLSWRLCANFMIICESFENRPNQSAAELISNEYIGVIKMFEQEHRIPVVWQTKSYGCGFFTKDKLKKLRKHMQTKGGHANDSMSHLLQWMVHGPLNRIDILEALR